MHSTSFPYKKRGETISKTINLNSEQKRDPSMGKKAVVIGCNYPGTEQELKGCVNDAGNVQNCLIERFGFSLDDMEVLIDTDPSFAQSTGKNICSALERLVGSSCPGDFLFVYYSGHGTRLPDESDESDYTGYDECIAPTDMNFIADDYFKELVSLVPEGCRITIVSDSCHSGGLIDCVKEQIGESTRANQTGEPVEDGTQEAFEEGGKEQNENRKAKSLSVSDVIDLLKQKTGKEDIDIGKVRPTLFDMFGEDSSPTVKKFMKRMLSKLKRNKGKGDEGGGSFMSLVDSLMKQKLNDSENPGEPELQTEPGSEGVAKDGAAIQYIPKNGVLLSGCQTYQFSADVRPEGEKAYGAFTNAILTVLAESNESVSNYELVTKVREILESKGYTQQPGLYCSDEHAEAAFIC